MLGSPYQETADLKGRISTVCTHPYGCEVLGGACCSNGKQQVPHFLFCVLPNLNMENMKFCPQCGSKLEQTNRFCPACGVNLEALSSNAMVIQPSAIETPCPSVNQHPQSSIQIDITPIEQRPQYKEAMEKKSNAQVTFAMAIVTTCLTIYCVVATGFWAGVGEFFWGWCALISFSVALKSWNRHKKLLDMSNREYEEERLKKERLKKEVLEAAGGFASGFVQGWMSNRNGQL